jgi:hypothetical protein
MNELVLFHQYTKELLKNPEPIPLKTIHELQNIALKNLGLSNLNQLRDKFEGQAYLNRFLLSVTAQFIADQHFKVETDFILKMSSLKNNANFYSHSGTNYRLISILYGTIPEIPLDATEPLIFCIVQKNYRGGWIIGSLLSYEFTDPTLFYHITSPILKSKKFIGFDQIVPFQ